MGFSILVRHLYIESWPRFLYVPFTSLPFCCKYMLYFLGRLFQTDWDNSGLVPSAHCHTDPWWSAMVAMDVIVQHDALHSSVSSWQSQEFLPFLPFDGLGIDQRHADDTPQGVFSWSDVIDIKWWMVYIEFFCHHCWLQDWNNYSKTSSISHTKSQNLNVPHLVLQLSVPNSLKPGV